jgi:hypothetical protein
MQVGSSKNQNRFWEPHQQCDLKRVIENDLIGFSLVNQPVNCLWLNKLIIYSFIS